jgi:predicted Zn-dependent peptidase
MSSSSVKASGHTLEVLDHGVRLITAPLGERNSVSLAAMFRVGSRYEPLELAGASHFIEHMLFKGSEGYPSAKAVAEAIEGVGGLLNAATDKELTMYWAKVSHDKLPLAVDVLCDILQRPLLDPAELDKEREVIIEELRMYQDSPADHVHSVFEQMLWENHPLGVDVAGTEASLRAMTVSRLRAHLESHYLAPGLVLAVAGHVDHDQVIELLAPRIGWREAPLPRFVPSSPPPAEPRVRIVRRDTEQANIVFGTHCVSYNHPDRFTIDLMNTVLGEGMSSRLFLEVRERQGLCYDVHSWAGKLADTGSAGVYIGTDPGRAPAAVAAVMDELRRICEEPVGDAELTKAREYYKGRLLLHLEGTNSLATWLGGQLLLTDRILEVEDIVAAIETVTAEDVMRIARQTYAEQALQMAVVGPLDEEDPLLERLRWN